jgi:hypothetical protein
MIRALAQTMLGAWLFMLAVPVAAQCPAVLQSIGTLPLVQYDPFSGAQAHDTLNVELRIDGDRTGCALGLAVYGLAPGNGRTASLGGSSLVYRLRLNGNELANAETAILPVLLPEGNQPTIPISIEVPAGQISIAGTYSDPVTIRLFDMGDGNAPLGPDASASINIAMESRAEVNIAGSSVQQSDSFGLSRLDFGTLEQGTLRQAMLQIRSTAPVELRVQSDHRSHLERIGGRGESIAYELRLDDVPMSLATAASSLTKEAAPTLNGSRTSLSLRITGDPKTVPAGDYRDLLTVDVAPR